VLPQVVLGVGHIRKGIAADLGGAEFGSVLGEGRALGRGLRVSPSDRRSSLLLPAMALQTIGGRGFGVRSPPMLISCAG
jgi:hypothetical protein